MSITAAAALVGVLASVMVAAPVKPAQAQGFFERLFGGPRYANDARYQRVYRDRRSQRYYDHQRRYREQQRAHQERRYRERQRQVRRHIPRVTIASPKFYNYTPDALKRYSLAALAKFETASIDEQALPIEQTPFNQARVHLTSFKLRTLPEVAEAIKAHYQERPQFIWVSNGAVNERARAAMAVLAQADRFGLRPADYRVDAPDALVADATKVASIGAGSALGDTVAEPAAASPGEEPGSERERALIGFEMELSASVLTYALDAVRGRVDPNRLSGYHDFTRKQVDLDAALDEIATADDVAQWLEARHPDHAPFRALTQELARLKAKDSGPGIDIAAGTFIRPGEASSELADVIAAIEQRGSDKLKDKHAATLDAYDGSDRYTRDLVQLVRDFQRENRLSADGIIGRNTIARLEVDSNADKIAKVQLAMERLRWLPRNLGARHVLINQAAYRATYSENGKPALSMKVVVGKPENQTYFFSDTIERVEYNPYWGVPRSIIVNEMLPKLARDPRYLDRLGYQVTNSRGRRVSSSAINWYAVATGKSQVGVRQPPGPKNALGELKILFPNKHAIYMHDTPHQNLFQRATRAYSHGCVRLEDPRAMAAAVLGKSRDHVAAQIRGGKNKAEKVTRDVPVHVAYFTAWPTDSGKVGYYADVYERDAYLTKAIKRTNQVRGVEG